MSDCHVTDQCGLIFMPVHSTVEPVTASSGETQVQTVPKSALTKSHRRQTALPKHVHFTAESLILTAALEGDLALLKQCAREVLDLHPMCI